VSARDGDPFVEKTHHIVVRMGQINWSKPSLPRTNRNSPVSERFRSYVLLTEYCRPSSNSVDGSHALLARKPLERLCGDLIGKQGMDATSGRWMKPEPRSSLFIGSLMVDTLKFIGPNVSRNDEASTWTEIRPQGSNRGFTWGWVLQRMRAFFKGGKMVKVFIIQDR